jgi:hypothetical protein
MVHLCFDQPHEVLTPSHLLTLSQSLGRCAARGDCLWQATGAPHTPPLSVNSLHTLISHSHTHIVTNHTHTCAQTHPQTPTHAHIISQKQTPIHTLRLFPRKTFPRHLCNSRYRQTKLYMYGPSHHHENGTQKVVLAERAQPVDLLHLQFRLMRVMMDNYYRGGGGWLAPAMTDGRTMGRSRLRLIGEQDGNEPLTHAAPSLSDDDVPVLMPASESDDESDGGRPDAER